MNIVDILAITGNAISVVIYYIIIIYSYNKYLDSKEKSSTIIGKYIGIPIVLGAVGFILVIVVLLYFSYVIIIGTVNLIRGRKFLADIETFGFFED